MATATKVCKVCGNSYEYCHTIKRVDGVFRWQDVACCPEHGSVYLAKIEASRAIRKPVVDIPKVSKEIYECDDALFENDFDDNEEEVELTIK